MIKDDLSIRPAGAPLSAISWHDWPTVQTVDRDLYSMALLVKLDALEVDAVTPRA